MDGDFGAFLEARLGGWVIDSADERDLDSNLDK